MKARTRRSPPAPVTAETPSAAIPDRGGTLFTTEAYTLARAAYLTHGTVDSVVKAAGVSYERATRLIESGEPRLGLPSLRDAARAVAGEVDRRAKRSEVKAAVVVAEEHAKVLEARAQAARRSREHEAKVLGDAETSRAEEVRLVRANRQSALVLAQVNAELLRAGVKLARSLGALTDGEVAAMTPTERLRHLRHVTEVVQRTAQTSASAVQMERLLMGQPTAILGRADPSPQSDMTPDEAEAWLELANRAFDRRAKRATPIDATPTEPTDQVAQLLEDL